MEQKHLGLAVSWPGRQAELHHPPCFLASLLPGGKKTGLWPESSIVRTPWRREIPLSGYGSKRVPIGNSNGRCSTGIGSTEVASALRVRYIREQELHSNQKSSIISVLVGDNTSSQRTLDKHHKKQHSAVSVQAQDRPSDKQHVLVKWTSKATRILFPTSDLRVDANFNQSPACPVLLAGADRHNDSDGWIQDPFAAFVRSTAWGLRPVRVWIWSQEGRESGWPTYLCSGNSESRLPVRMSDSEGQKRKDSCCAVSMEEGTHSVGIHLLS